jgi:hypothetical protein
LQFIETTLAFAVTMLVLSMVVSTFVELIHRIFSMREAGLKYMLGQLFDQVLAPYVEKFNAKNPALASSHPVEVVRDSFVQRMSANRAPMGAEPKPTPSDSTAAAAEGPKWFSKEWFNNLKVVRLWNGRDLASMTPAEFMERLGSIDIGAAIKEANAAANDDLKNAGAYAAEAADSVLRDVAQKFEAFGKEAGSYFEGRARLLSVIVAIVLAFAIHVDAIELFQTFLRDPNVRAKVIEQTEAVTARQQAAQDQLATANKPALSTGAAAGAPASDQAPAAEGSATAKPDVEVAKLKKDLQAAIADLKATKTQLTDLGVPIGWSEDRLKAARMSQWIWTCPGTGPDAWQVLQGGCEKDKRNIWLQVPGAPSVWFYLLIGGLLIGLGSPFWYNVVTGFTNIRSVASSITGTSAQSQTTAAAAAAQADKAQPVTPVGVFKVSNAAIAAQKK